LRENIPQVRGGRLRYHHQRRGHVKGGSREGQIPPPADISQVKGGRIRYHHTTNRGHVKGGRRKDQIPLPEDIPQGEGRFR
jgi:5-methylcytosine-specific restriction endonuclease McrA